MGKWELEQDTSQAIIWKNKKNPKLTIEAHRFHWEDAESIGAEWYVYPAKDGKGIPSSPHLTQTKTDARREIARLKKVV